jgi:hypothetical protein
MVKRWARKVRRRTPGIYLVRTDRHMRPGRENGYVGLSNNLELRRRQHLKNKIENGRIVALAKPWSDLDPVWHYLRLPWWLGWRWCLAPLEFLAIKLLLPRYNHTMNLANPRRVPLGTQRAQRLHRDRQRKLGHRLDRRRSTAAGAVLLRTLGVLAILVGVGMTVWTRW